MKIECIKEKLGIALSKVEKITSKNLTLPVLQCVLLEAKNSTLVLKATNLDLGIELSLPVKVEREGVVAVPGHLLGAFFTTTKNDKNVVLEVKENSLVVANAHHSVAIRAMAHEDFPTLPKVSADDPQNLFSIEPADFVRGLKSVFYASAVSSMKPELSSVYLYPDRDMLVFAATDSFRLAEKRIKTRDSYRFHPILLPFKNVTEIIRLLEGESRSCEVVVTKNQISIRLDGVYLTSRIVDGAFPDYKQIIPKEFKTEATLLKQDLQTSLKVATLFSDKFNQINIKIKPPQKSVLCSTKNNDVGESVSTVSATTEGDSVDANFNHKYIVDAFQSVPQDSISLSWSSKEKPMVIRGVGDSSFTYLVMPMNK